MKNMTIIMVTDDATRTKNYVEAANAKGSFNNYQLNYVEVPCPSTDLHDHLSLVNGLGLMPEAIEAGCKANECENISMIVIDLADAGMTALIFHDVVTLFYEELLLSEDRTLTLDDYITSVALIVSGKLHKVIIHVET